MNWGWRITIFLTCFISFIMYMVVYSFSTTNDLVAEDYYNQEIQYQSTIDAQKNALYFNKGVSVTSIGEIVQIQFPDHFDLTPTDGEIFFYRPDNAKLDKRYKLELTTDKKQFLNKSEIAPGFYKVSIEFKDGSKSYIMNKEIWI